MIIGKNLSQDKTSSPSKVNDGGTLRILTFGQETSQVCSTEKTKDLSRIKAILLNTVWIQNNQVQMENSALVSLDGSRLDVVDAFPQFFLGI